MYREIKFYSINNNIKVLWEREDGEKITNTLTISDFNFLIKNKKGLLVLKPISDLLVEVVSECSELDLIVEELDYTCDYYREWSNSWQENIDIDKLKQAPFELFMDLINRGYDVFNLIEKGYAINLND